MVVEVKEEGGEVDVENDVCTIKVCSLVAIYL
jgi:hypothetical protein